MKAIECSKGQKSRLKFQNNIKKLQFYYGVLPEYFDGTSITSFTHHSGEFQTPKLFPNDFVWKTNFYSLDVTRAWKNVFLPSTLLGTWIQSKIESVVVGIAFCWYSSFLTQCFKCNTLKFAKFEFLAFLINFCLN